MLSKGDPLAGVMPSTLVDRSNRRRAGELRAHLIVIDQALLCRGEKRGYSELRRTETYGTVLAMSSFFLKNILVSDI